MRQRNLQLFLGILRHGVEFDYRQRKSDYQGIYAEVYLSTDTYPVVHDQFIDLAYPTRNCIIDYRPLANEGIHSGDLSVDLPCSLLPGTRHAPCVGYGIFYPVSILEEHLAWVINVNPLYYFVTFVRSCLIDGISPEPIMYVKCALFALGMLIVGASVFKKTQDHFVLYL